MVGEIRKLFPDRRDASPRDTRTRSMIMRTSKFVVMNESRRTFPTDHEKDTLVAQGAKVILHRRWKSDYRMTDIRSEELI